MRVCDLTDPGNSGELRVDAEVRLLAVMLLPTEREVRRSFLERLRSFHAGEPMNLSSPDDDLFVKQYFSLHGRGCQAGQIFLTLLQLAAHGMKPTLSKAIRLQQPMLEGYVGHAGGKLDPYVHVEHLTYKRSKLFDLVKEFRPVIHLWAAHVHAMQVACEPLPSDRPPPRSREEALGRLIADAEVFWRMFASSEGKPLRDGQPMFRDADRLRVRVPASLACRQQLKALRRDFEKELKRGSIIKLWKNRC